MKLRMSHEPMAWKTDHEEDDVGDESRQRQPDEAVSLAEEEQIKVRCHEEEAGGGANARKH